MKGGRLGRLAIGLVSLALLAACSSESVSVAVETVAGSGERGSNDTPYGQAQFTSPEGIALATDGTIYVAETLSGRIRKISPDGVVTTIFGAEGVDDEIKLPHRLSVGPEGGLFVTDAGNNRIVRITEEGQVLAVAGNGEPGDADGPANEAQFSFPIGIAVGRDGTIYVADSGNHKVRKITPGGVVVTVAGTGQAGFNDGAAAEAQFAGLNELTLDDAGNIYVTEVVNNRVRKISPEGFVTTVAGSGKHGFADGDPAKAKFSSPSGIAIDAAGNIYVAEIGNQRIRKIVPDQLVLTVAGSGEPGLKDGLGTKAQFKVPTALAIRQDGVIFVADSRNHVIRKLTP